MKFDHVSHLHMSWKTVLLLKVLAYSLNGITFKLLWQWFMVEGFNLPGISFLNATGFGIMVRFVCDHYIPRNMGEEVHLLKHAFFSPAIALVTGFLIYMLILIGVNI